MRKFIIVFVISSFGLFSTDAKAQLSINGSIKGSDGAPLKKGLLIVSGPEDFYSKKQIKSDGSYNITLPYKGGYYLYIKGVHHKAISMPIVVSIQKEVSLKVRMQSMSYNSNPDSVFLIGNFNDFSTNEGLHLMQKRADRSFTKKLKADSDSLKYQILGIAQTKYGNTYPISGTEISEDISVINKAPWEEGHFATSKIISANEVTINFDINKLPDGSSEENINFSDPTLDEIISIYREVENQETKIGSARGNDSVVERFQDDHKSKLKDEKNPILKQLLLLRYFDELHPQKSDSTLANRVLEEVPPTSPFWSLEARSSVGASNIMFVVGRISNKPNRVDEYINNVIQQHSDSDVRAQFLYLAFNRAENNDDKKLMSQYFNKLKSNHSDSRQFEQVRREFAPNRAIQVGNSVPDFKFTALSDSSKILSNDNYKGKFLLVDFWGTWCAPCIEEMPHLHEAYKTFKDQDFEILSVAFWDERSKIEKFRNERYPMPWDHTLISEEDHDRIHSKFEITGIPRPILVDPNGNIIALDEQIRGEKLVEKLSSIFE